MTQTKLVAVVWRLVDLSTGLTLSVGARVRTFRGEPCTVVGLRPPHKVDSSGHVTVRFKDGHEAEFYPSVVGARWDQRDGRCECSRVPRRKYAAGARCRWCAPRCKVCGELEVVHEPGDTHRFVPVQ